MRITLRDVSKRFGTSTAVDGLSLEIAPGELVALVGGSGCGKTTTLRLVAGFERPDAGEVRFDDRVVNDVPPARRGVGIVFQSYALFPTMTVAENIAFGLRVARWPQPRIRDRVEELLALMHLGGLGGRYANQLSGGQQQRVALARALAGRPEILLRDEPLSALDAKIRLRLRAEIRKIQQDLGVTTLYVTHDQEEALSLADRLAVMRGGRIEQLGRPEEVYGRPRTDFVADFIGISNLVPCRVVSAADGVLEWEGRRLRAACDGVVGPADGEGRHEDRDRRRARGRRGGSRHRRRDARHSSVHDVRARARRLVPARAHLLAQQRAQSRRARGVPDRAGGRRGGGGVLVGLGGDRRRLPVAGPRRPRRRADGRVLRHGQAPARGLRRLGARDDVRRHDRPRRRREGRAADDEARVGGVAVQPAVESERPRPDRRPRARGRRSLRGRQHHGHADPLVAVQARRRPDRARHHQVPRRPLRRARRHRGGPRARPALRPAAHAADGGRGRAVAVRLLARAPRHPHAAGPGAGAVRARAEGRDLPGRPPARRARALSRAAGQSRTRDRPAPDGDVRRHALGSGQGRRGGGHGRGREGARLHAGDELRRHREPRRAPRVDRGPRYDHARQPAARVDRPRAPRRSDRGLHPGARMTPATRLDGRTALVTGAGRGIGLAISERLLADGARVVMLDRDAAAVEGAAKRLGPEARAIVADVTRTADVERAVRAAHEWHDRLDVVVNNAGITGRSFPTWELTDEDWQQVIAVDLTSVFLVCRAAVKLMRPRRSGRIVNIASIAGKEGNPTLVPYSTAKAGVIGLTKALAKEVATQGILVNAVAPAVIGTELLQQMERSTVDMLVAKIPMGRVGKPEEVAALVAWLSSDECSFSTGAVYDLSGGRATY